MCVENTNNVYKLSTESICIDDINSEEYSPTDENIHIETETSCFHCPFFKVIHLGVINFTFDGKAYLIITINMLK